jgi:thiamine pyrophosphate-dependent acetolactate synthase large subunit-like protein
MNLRHEYIAALAQDLKDEIIVCNSGGVQDDLYSAADREANIYGPGVGLVCQVALGVALAIPERTVIALDGDGSLLLNLGILPVLADQKPKNLFVIVFDNGVYEAGGNVPTLASKGTKLEELARGAGIQGVAVQTGVQDFVTDLKAALSHDGLRFFVVKVKPGRVAGAAKTISGMENKFRFMRYVEGKLGKNIFQPPTQRYTGGKSSDK